MYPNGDKYEGSWEGGKRHGMGILWLYDNGRHRVRYSGEWAHDRFHVSARLACNAVIGCSCCYMHACWQWRSAAMPQSADKP